VDPFDEDIVNHPRHYTQGIECFDYITSHGMSYAEGAVVKYITRYKLKGKPLQDLQKAKWYLDQLISQQQAAEDAEGLFDDVSQ